ncbi:MAG: DUF4440 domain-containing protein [Desertimonas sp.]
MSGVTIDDARAVGLVLPRAYEVIVRDRVKFRVGAIVFVGFSEDEAAMGFGFPREEREDLVADRPETFFLPPQRDMRFQLVCAHLAQLDAVEMRELVIDAWRMCVPKMLHDLPEQPPEAMAAWAAWDRGDLGAVRDLLAPSVVWEHRRGRASGRADVLASLAERQRVRPPRDVEVVDGRIVRWAE